MCTRIKIDFRRLWTDSTVTRHWIRAVSALYKPYVGNRVGEIQQLTTGEEWSHLPGTMNIADLATRAYFVDGVERIPKEWIEGPKFLYGPKEEWPPDIDFTREPSEIKAKYEFLCLAVRATAVTMPEMIEKTPNYWRLHRRVANWFRWVEKARASLRARATNQPAPAWPNVLSKQLMDRAHLALCYLDQRVSFPLTISDLEAGKELNRDNAEDKSLLTLHPFLDKNGLLRVGGRVGRSALPFDAKHPIILSSKGVMGPKVTAYLHDHFHHPGTNHMLSLLRERYWVLAGRELCKKISRRCAECHKERSSRLEQLMADLPHERVNPAAAFKKTTVDFFGPFTIFISRGRTEKRWGALFTCMTTRAVHLESASGLSTPDFMNVLRIFICTRGKPDYIYSDNGTNFEGAAPLLQPAAQDLTDLQALAQDSLLSEELAKEGIIWQFQPPRAPHFGGVHEALVKSVKRAMHFIMSKEHRPRLLRDDEFRVLLAEAMGFLNSRPLTYISNDKKDGILTPAHFLFQRENSTLLPGISEAPFDPANTFLYAQAYANDLWRAWMQEYLPALTTRSKWQSSRRNAQVGDLVLVVEDLLPRNKWAVGLIDATFPDRHGFVRAVDVRLWTTGKNDKRKITVYRRPIRKICLLQEAPGSDGPPPRMPVPDDFQPRAVMPVQDGDQAQSSAPVQAGGSVQAGQP
jgi:hypothetical protein